MAERKKGDGIAGGIFWKLMENGGSQGLQFVTALFLARMLGPAEYGTIGLIMIFITISNVFVQSGFSTALIQKKGTDALDYFSVCYFELAFCGLLYALLFLAAPAIASFYGIGVLCPVVRVLALVLFPGAVISVQTACLSRRMQFRGIFAATFCAAAISGAVSIWLAARGFGVWAMVWQQVIYSFGLMIFLLPAVGRLPRRLFSAGRLAALLSFGWKLLCASLLDTVYNNLCGLFIGKLYNEETLGAYNRGEQFPKLIASNLSSAMQAVLLPVFSENQDDTGSLKRLLRSSVCLSSFAVLPMLLGMFAVADDMVLLLLGERWMVCLDFLRLMCISYCFWPIHIANLQAINAMGRSDIFLKLEIIKKVLGLAALFIGIQHSVFVLVALKTFQDFLCTIINAWPCGRLLGYGAGRQWRDMAPGLLSSAAMCGAILLLGHVLPAQMFLPARLFLRVAAGAVIYLAISLPQHGEGAGMAKSMLQKVFLSKHKTQA